MVQDDMNEIMKKKVGKNFAVYRNVTNFVTK